MLLGTRVIHGSVEGRKCGINHRHFTEMTAKIDKSVVQFLAGDTITEKKLNR